MTDGRRAPKVGHKKTRTGCLKCRARRVKCDEGRPYCANCHRLGLACEYGTGSTSDNIASLTNSAATTPEASIATNSVSFPTYLQRMQLKFLHAYSVRALTSLAARSYEETKDWIEAWFILLPKLAIQHDNLLYALLAFSGTQVMAFEPDVVVARNEFWAIALKEQRNTIAVPDHNVEAAVLAGYMLCMTSFGMLRERQLHPYSPPMDWFELAQGALSVCPEQEDLPDEATVLLTTFKVTAPLLQSVYTIDQAYKHILAFRVQEEKDAFHDTDHNGETSYAYEKTLMIVSGFRKTVLEREPPWSHTRWICTLPQLVPSRFVTLLREQRPRAMVTMMCFWAMLAQTDSVVLKAYGDVEGALPRREIDAIMTVLPTSWQALAAGLIARGPSG